jgi:hypothetical protein
LGSFVNIEAVDQNVGVLFSTEKSDELILAKMCLADFWAFFHKLIWSPWWEGESRR